MTSLTKAGLIFVLPDANEIFSAKCKYKADICLSKQVICSRVYLILV